MKRNDPFFSAFLKTAKARRLLEPGDRILVAVSGGQDSVALLHLLTRIQRSYPLYLAVAHLNHALRSSSDAEEASVKALAENFSLPFVSMKLEVAALAAQNKESLETAARNARREFLRSAAKEFGCNKVALGHTSDDQAETVLMRLIRGSGGRGLSGISYRNPLAENIHLVRPILDLSRSDTEAYCQQHHLNFATDESNEDQTFFRNWVRHSAIPLLSEKNPALPTSLNRLSRNLSDDEEGLLWAVEEAVGILNPRPAEGGLMMEKSLFFTLPLALQKRVLERLILQNWGECANLARDKIDQLQQLQESGAGEKRLCLTPLVELRFGPEGILLGAAPQPSPATMRLETSELPVPGNMKLPFCSASVHVEVLKEGDGFFEAIRDEGTFDLPAVFAERELVFRPRRDGDRLFGRKKKVKEFLIDKKICRSLRDHLPMLACNGNEVLWIPGHFRARVPESQTSPSPIIRIRFRQITE